MKLDEKTILKVPEDLYIDLAVSESNNKYNEDVYLLYNPTGYGGILAVGKEIVELIKLFDGKRNIKSIIEESVFSKNDYQEILAIISSLVEKQMLIGTTVENKNAVWQKELTCWLHITNDCNLRCKYCYIHKNCSNMPNSIVYESIDRMLDSCRKNNYSKLCLMLVGGEPLMRFELIKEIVDYCTIKKGNISVRYVIPTNGTLITPKVAKYIAQHNISVGISIDGIEKYHDENRIKIDGSGSYKLAMRGVDNMIEQGIKPSIMVTVTQQNLEGLPELTKLLIDKKIFFRFSFERDTSTGHPAILNNEDHCIEILKECFKIMEKSIIDGKLGWNFQFGDVTFSRPVRRTCAAGKNFFAIGQDGSIGSCSLGLELPKANINDLSDIITDIDKIFSDISKTSACDVEQCSKCIWRHSCAGACPLQTYATFKTFLQVSPYCKLYKACLPDVIRISAMNIYYTIKKEE